jgi:hypothetical protein
MYDILTFLKISFLIIFLQQVLVDHFLEAVLDLEVVLDLALVVAFVAVQLDLVFLLVA